MGTDTEWMTREGIVWITYEVGGALNDLKLEAGLVEEATHAAVARHFAIALDTFPRIDALEALAEPARREAPRN